MNDEDLDSLRAKAEQAVSAVTQVPSDGAVSAVGAQPWTPSLVLWLTISIILFAVIVFAFMWLCLKAGHRPGDTLRLATMPMVIVAAIFLVLLGFSNEQMTPVIGLLGTLIGYVLGSATVRGASPDPPPSNTSTTTRPPTPGV
jgi:hypothetical protein